MTRWPDHPMNQFSRRRAPCLVTATAVLSLLAAGCGISAPSSNVVDVFMGTLEVNGFVIHTFGVGKDGGEVNIKITSISPDSGATVGMLYGQFTGGTNNCNPITQAVATQGRTAITNRIAKGDYCLAIFDPGGGLIVRAETYTVEVSHP